MADKHPEVLVGSERESMHISLVWGLVSLMISTIFLLKALLSFVSSTGNILCFWFCLYIAVYMVDNKY